MNKENNNSKELTPEIIMQMFAETDKKFAETRELIRQQSINIGGISRSNGQIAEDAIYTALERDMIFAGIEFHDIIRNQKKHRKALGIKGEYDIVLINGTMLAIIETKYKVEKKDVTKLATTQLTNFRTLFPEYANHKIVLGIGGMGFEDDAIKEANTNGIGLIRIVGEKLEFQTENIKQY